MFGSIHQHTHVGLAFSNLEGYQLLIQFLYSTWAYSDLFFEFWWIVSFRELVHFI